MEYLGFWVTRNGIRLINNKVEAIVNIMQLNTQKHVCAFIVLVKYHMDMWAKRSHLLHPLTALMSNKVKFKCTYIEQEAFDEIKRIVSRNTLLEYPYLNKSFGIHTDASDYQLGSVSIQDVKPITL